MAASNETASEHRRYWLITSPRTASNMLVRIMNLDAQGARPAWNGGYFWFEAGMHRMKLATKPYNEWTEDEISGLAAANQKCFDKLQDFLADSEKDNQIVFVKEHAMLMNDAYFENHYDFGARGTGDKARPPPSSMKGSDSLHRSALNRTSVPDEFLKTWFPTFLIRHPGLMLPSMFRAAQRDFGMGGAAKELNPSQVTMQWIRELYMFYADYFSEAANQGDGTATKWPIILDADDVMAYPELVTKYASLAGLDPEKLKFSWEKQDNKEGLTGPEKVMLSSINGSQGVDLSKMAGDMDLDAEAKKWRAEFGEEDGARMEKWVRDCMPDYEYMRARRLTLN